MTAPKLLPAGFQELEPFAQMWDIRSGDARRALRMSMSMSEIQAFYDAVQPRTEEALAYIDQFPIDALPDDAQRLMRILLGLVHAAVSVEIHQQHRGRYVPPTDSIRTTRDLVIQ